MHSMFWRRDPNKKYPLDSLSNIQKEELIQDLDLPNQWQRDYALSTIDFILDDYQAELTRENYRESASHERQRGRVASKALKDASESIKILGADSWDLLLDHNESEEVPLERLPAVLECWAGEILEVAEKHIFVEPGRQKQVALGRAVSDLAYFYKALTGRQPGLSSAPEKKPNSKARDVHGPFVRFCRSTIFVVTPTEFSTVENMIRSVLREGRKKAGPDWPIIPPENMLT